MMNEWYLAFVGCEVDQGDGHDPWSIIAITVEPSGQFGPHHFGYLCARCVDEWEPDQHRIFNFKEIGQMRLNGKRDSSFRESFVG